MRCNSRAYRGVRAKYSHISLGRHQDYVLHRTPEGPVKFNGYVYQGIGVHCMCIYIIYCLRIKSQINLAKSSYGKHMHNRDQYYNTYMLYDINTHMNNL